MAKGDDAVMRKRKKVRRKRMRDSESSVSARVAAIIATKRRRKSGKRRKCEGMCFSLPTPEDPFNDRHGKNHHHHQQQQDKKKKKQQQPPPKNKNDKQQPRKEIYAMSESQLVKKDKVVEEEESEYDGPSKLLIVCLNAIWDAWKQDGNPGDGPLSASSWGVELCRCCAAASNVLDTSGGCASAEQVAWVASIACDMVARKEKHGLAVACPFLLYLVPSQEMALQVRSICKALKPLGIHSVSLHPGASIDHQISGIKSCEPEFLIATPERLLELVSLKSVDISTVSLLVIDGLKCFMDLNVGDKLSSIRNAIVGNPEVIIFSGSCDQGIANLARTLLGGSITRLSLNDSVACQSALVSQCVHFCPSEGQKTSKVKEILMQILNNHTMRTAKALLVAGSDQKAQHLSSSLRQEICTVSDDSRSNSFTICSSVGVMKVLVEDEESMSLTDVEEFEIVLVVDFPPLIENYVEILKGTARHSVSGAVHSVFCHADAPLAQPLVGVLTQCGQTVPEFLANFDSL